jgi:RNA polymerase sigma factor (sigma-70 family)
MTNEEIVQEIQNDQNIKDNMAALYIQNKKFIYQQCRPYFIKLGQDDALQIAYFALVKAVQNYRSDKEFSFLATLKICIRNVMIRNTDLYGNSKRIPCNLSDRIRKYLKFIEEYKNEYQQLPSKEDVKKALAISDIQYNRLMDAIESQQNPISISAPIETEEGIGEYLEFVPDDSEPFADTVIDQIVKREDSKILWNEVENLPMKQSLLIKEKYLNMKKPEEIENLLEVPHYTYFRLQNKAFDTLRKSKSVYQCAADYGIVGSSAYHGTLGKFQNTGESSVEHIVIEKLTKEGY